MQLDFQKSIGFAVLLVLFVCSTTFACEHHRIAAKLMQTQNCSFNISNFNLTSDNVQALRTQQLETIQNVNNITKLSVDMFLEQNAAFRSLALTFTSGLRFGNSFVTLPEDIQLGSGHLNFRKSINSTGYVLKRFGGELNEMVEQLKLVSDAQSVASFLQINQQHWFSRKMNQIIDATLSRMIRVDFRQEPAFHGIFVIVLNGFKFGLNLHGIGQFNWCKSIQDSNVLLKSFADGLIDIANQWEQMLLQQKQSCESYLQETFAPAVEINPRSNTTVVVVANNETMQANANSTTVSPVSEVQSNLTTTVSPVSEVQSNLTTTVSPVWEAQSNLTTTVSPVSEVQSNLTTTVSPVSEAQSNLTTTVSTVLGIQSNLASPNSPVSQVVANLTSIARQLNIDQLLTNLTNSYGQQNAEQLITRIQSIFNATSF